MSACQTAPYSNVFASWVRESAVPSPHFYSILPFVILLTFPNTSMITGVLYPQRSEGDVSLLNTTSMAAEKLPKLSFPTIRISCATVKNGKGYSLCNNTFRSAIPLSNLAPGCGFKAITHSIPGWLIATHIVPNPPGLRHWFLHFSRWREKWLVINLDAILLT